MKKTFVIILIISYFNISQARPIGHFGGGAPLWLPVVAVVTVFGLVDINKQNERRDYEDQVRETVILLEEANTLEELDRVKRVRLRYFNQSLQSLYLERKNNLGHINYSNKNITDQKNLTIFLIQDADTLEELEKIKQERLEYFTDEVQDKYFKKKNSLK